jgi:hypothetical protein
MKKRSPKDFAIKKKSSEWKAKLDIAEIEAAQKAVETTFKSIDKTIKSTGEILNRLNEKLGIES